MTSAVNIALGNWVFPHLFQMCYSAQSATAIRRNAVWQPLYSLAYFFIILLGFAALLAACSRPTTISTRRCCIRRHVPSGVGDRRWPERGSCWRWCPAPCCCCRPARSSRAISRSRSAGPVGSGFPAPVARGAGVLCRAGGVPVHIRRQLPGAHPAQCLRGDRHAGAAGVLGFLCARRHTACWPGWWRVSSPCWRRSRPAIGPAPCPNGSRD